MRPGGVIRNEVEWGEWEERGGMEMRLFNFGNELSIFFIECISFVLFVFEIGGDWWGFDWTKEIVGNDYLIIQIQMKKKKKSRIHVFFSKSRI